MRDWIAIGFMFLLATLLAAWQFDWLRRTTPGSYTPRGDRVIVKRLERPSAQPGSLFVPDSQQKPLDEGTVIAVGPTISDIKAGQVVCFVEFAGTEIEVDGEGYLSMRESEIHGVRG